MCNKPSSSNQQPFDLAWSHLGRSALHWPTWYLLGLPVWSWSAGGGWQLNGLTLQGEGSGSRESQMHCLISALISAPISGHQEGPLPGDHAHLTRSYWALFSSHATALERSQTLHLVALNSLWHRCWAQGVILCLSLLWEIRVSLERLCSTQAWADL